MSYIPAAEVKSPKRNWALVSVLIDEGEGKCAYAVGLWDEERRIGMRWNGTKDNPLGNPQSRGLPTWTMLDEDLHMAVLSLVKDDKKRLEAEMFLGARPSRIELKIDEHPSGNLTLCERPLGQAMFSDIKGKLLANDNKQEFYIATLKVIAEHLSKGREVVLKGL